MQRALDDAPIQTKLRIGFGALSCVLVGVALFGADRLRTLNAAAAEMGRSWLPGVGELGQIQYFATRYRLYGAREVMTKDRAQLAQLQVQQAALDEAMAASLARFEALPRTPEERKLYTDFRTAWTNYHAAQEELLANKGASSIEALAAGFNGETLVKFNAMIKAMGALVESENAGAQAAADYAERAYFVALLALAAAVGLGLILAAAAAIMITRSVAAPAGRLTEAIRRITEGQAAVEMPDCARADEIGTIARALAGLETQRREADRLAQAQAREQHEKRARQEEIERLMGSFQSASSAAIETVAAAATQLQHTALSMQAEAQQTSTRAQGAAAACEQTNANVQSVAGASEEMAASIAEISRQVAQSARVASAAVQDAARTREIVHGLAGSAQSIGEVIDLINAVAAQTNLLALNATIEAARAGEAGKGFAVVASEVKSLATQTSGATLQIRQQIEHVQDAVTQAVAAMEGVNATISELSQIAVTIAGAIQQQDAASQQISRNVQQAAAGSRDVNRAMDDVQAGAAATGSAAKDVLSASSDLARQAEHLRADVTRLITDMEAA